MRRRSFLAQAGAMVGTRALARVIQFSPVSAASAAIRLNAQSPAASGSELEPLLSLFDFETEAHTRIPHGAWERISGGSADEITLHLLGASDSSTLRAKLPPRAEPPPQTLST